MIRRHVRSAPPRAVDESMTLINEVYRRPLDPGYAEAAAGRAGGTPRRTVLGAVAVLMIALALGLVTTTSTLALRRPAPAVLEARALLEKEIDERTRQADELRRSNAALAGEIARLQSEAASTDDPELFAQLQRDAVAAGVVPVTGPGVRVVLTDGVPDPTAASDDASAYVLDIDLQVLVNGLWAAGAEAVAVNGERITSTTAIRSAGAAVLVDSTALSSPYTVEAIGDAVAMQTALARTSAGQHLASLSQYGIDVAMSSQRTLDLPGRGQIALRSARVAGEDEAADDTGAAPGEHDVLGASRGDVAGSSRPDQEEAR